MKIIILIFLIKFAVVLAQVPYLTKQSQDVIKKCEQESGFTEAEYEELVKKSADCRDRVNEIEAARCYHVCIIKTRKYITEDEDVIPEPIIKLWSFLHKEYVELLMDVCTDSYRPVGGKCHKGYHMHKCFTQNVGSYPHLTKYLAITNVSSQIDMTCRTNVGITNEELCKVNAGTETNLYDSDKKARCYHTCILEEMGYLDDKGVKYEAVRKRFFYIPDDEFKKAFDKCNKVFTAVDKCDVVYGIHKCLKNAFGEYPLGDTRP